MQTSTRHKPRPELMAERGRDAAERRATVAEQKASATLLGAERLSIDLAEMREDRDRWRTQAERLAAALERLKAPGERVVAADPRPASAGGNHSSDDLLHHWTAIGTHLGITPEAARHLSRTAGLPVFKLGTKTVASSRRAIDAWLAEREAAAASGV